MDKPIYGPPHPCLFCRDTCACPLIDNACEGCVQCNQERRDSMNERRYQSPHPCPDCDEACYCELGHKCVGCYECAVKRINERARKWKKVPYGGHPKEDDEWPDVIGD